MVGVYTTPEHTTVNYYIYLGPLALSCVCPIPKPPCHGVTKHISYLSI